jgi:hypothetical protein
MLGVGQYQRAFLTTPQHNSRQADDDKQGYGSHELHYKRRRVLHGGASRPGAGTSEVARRSHTEGTSWSKSMNRFAAALSMAAVSACLASTSAFAENPLGFYMGLGVGESTVRSDNTYGFNSYYPYDGYYNSPDHHFAWKAIAGVRPISILGAELEYIDFGHPGSDSNYYNGYYNYGPDSHPRAIAAFGVGHLPLPLPFLDIYAKAGAARLHTIVNGFDGPACQPYVACGGVGGNPFSRSVWDTRFAYGAGVQSRFWGLSVRAEYERISSPYGDPDLFSVGATWTF